MHPRKFVRDWLGLALSNYLARGMLLLRGVMAAAALGPGGYGSWNALNLILDYGGYAPAGALEGLDLELPAAVAGQPGPALPSEAWHLLAGAWTIVTLGGALLAVAVALVLAFGRSPTVRSLGLAAPLLMLAAALLQLTIQYHLSALKARGEFGTVSRATVLQVLVGGGLGVALVWRHGIEGLLWGWLAGTALTLMLVRSRVAPPLLPADASRGRALVRAGFPVFACYATSLVLRSVDRLALLRFGQAADLGHYSVGLLAIGLVLYLPESAANVLYPRVAAAARARPGAPGAPDPEAARARARLEVTRAQRALCVALPLLVAIALPWAAPLVGRLLPAFRAGVPALCVLAAGALMLAVSTVPGYFMLASGHAPRLLVLGMAAAAFNAVLVFAVAARAPRPAPVAAAAATGYACFALGVVALAMRELFVAHAERWSFLAGSFAPALWGAALALAATQLPAAAALGAAESWGGALLRSAAVGLGYAPALWHFGRGVGLKRVAREWLMARRLPA